MVHTNPCMGTASGGVWRSDNDGLSWTSAFDSAGTMTIGTVANDPNGVWVGTGENNQGCEAYFGIGLVRTTDGGETWTHMGLKETHHIGRVVIHPRDPNIVFVAALVPFAVGVVDLLARCRRRGIARQLMQAIEAQARDAGRTLLVLDTESGSDAVPFYESQGWERCGSIPDFALSADGVPTANILYYKRV